MNEVKSNRKKLPNLIREFYSLYTSGYYFLEPLSSWSIHLDYINWDNLDEFERKKWINKNITKIIKDINKILTYFEEGKIKFIDDYEVDTFMCKYIDNRAKNKKANK
ncbi:MAG: hypothetical protein GX490_10040 [Bacilli bacterium]|nr:hypothetical protein [Bacilli bacterium]